MAGSINSSFMGVFRALIKLSFSQNPEICVETGTYQGESSLLFTKFFKRVHTIELSKKWYDFSRKKLKDINSIEFHLGESAEVLAKISPEINEPVFFYLDAHFAGGDTGFGKKEVPLNEELMELSKRAFQDIIVIDDLRLIGKTGKSGSDENTTYRPMTYDWRDVTLDKIAEIIGRGIKNVWFFKGDRIIIFRNRNLIQGFLLYLWILLGRILDYSLVKPYKYFLHFIRQPFQN